MTGSSHQVSQHLWRAVAVMQPSLAGLAASRRESRGVRLAATRLEEASGNSDDLAANFANFHVEIAKAAANPLLTSLIVSCLDNLLHQEAALLGGLARVADPPAYGKMADLIGKGQIEAAERHMRSLVDESADDGGVTRGAQALETSR